MKGGEKKEGAWSGRVRQRRRIDWPDLSAKSFRTRCKAAGGAPLPENPPEFKSSVAWCPWWRSRREGPGPSSRQGAEAGE